MDCRKAKARIYSQHCGCAPNIRQLAVLDAGVEVVAVMFEGDQNELPDRGHDSAE